jgi:hypothetical protein
MSEHVFIMTSGLETGEDIHRWHSLCLSTINFEEDISIAVPNNDTCRKKFISVHCNHFLLIFTGHSPGLFCWYEAST